MFKRRDNCGRMPPREGSATFGGRLRKCFGSLRVNAERLKDRIAFRCYMRVATEQQVKEITDLQEQIRKVRDYETLDQLSIYIMDRGIEESFPDFVVLTLLNSISRNPYGKRNKVQFENADRRIE